MGWRTKITLRRESKILPRRISRQSLSKVGGKPIAIPAPEKEMSEMKYDNKKIMEIFMPSNNRLVVGFMLTSDIFRSE